MPIATIEEMLDETGKFRARTQTYPQGDAIYYICKDGGILCSDCADGERELIEVAERETMIRSGI